MATRLCWRSVLGGVVLALGSDITGLPTDGGRRSPSGRKMLAERPSMVPGYLEQEYEYCLENNFVAKRGDRINIRYPNAQQFRSYSVTNNTLVKRGHFHGRECASLEETLLAISSGTRRWINASRALDAGEIREAVQSYFVPHGCDLRHLHPAELCSILNQFRHIYFIGDSLTRHLTQGLLIALRRDLILGGIQSSSIIGRKNPYHCRCDGQFSEHQDCRMNDGLFNDFIPHQLGVCSHLPEGDGQFHFHSADHNGILFGSNNKTHHCADPGNKQLVLFVLQGGVHFNSDAETTYRKLLNRVFNTPVFQLCNSNGLARVVWTAYQSQSRKLDRRYPLQSRERALAFNRYMETRLKGLEHLNHTPTIVDWWNLTRDAQTSDGFHYLTDVNLIKVNHLAHVLRYFPRVRAVTLGG